MGRHWLQVALATRQFFGCVDGTISLWDFETARDPDPHMRPLAGYALGTGSSVAFGPDGRILAAGADVCCSSGLLRGDQPRGRPLADDALRHPASSVAFGPDGRLLAAGGCGEFSNGSCIRGEVRLWDVATGEPRGQPLADYDGIVEPRVAFSPDGETIAAGGCVRPEGAENCAVQIWLGDAAGGQPRGEPLAADLVGMVWSSPSAQTAGRWPPAGADDGTPTTVSVGGKDLPMGPRERPVDLGSP